MRFGTLQLCDEHARQSAAQTSTKVDPFYAAIWSLFTPRLTGTGKLGGNRGNIDKANEAARVVANAHASKVLDTIKPLKEAGLTLQQIANTLNKSGVQTSRGGKWYPTTVSNILKRELA